MPFAGELGRCAVVPEGTVKDPVVGKETILDVPLHKIAVALAVCIPREPVKTDMTVYHPRFI
jgi:hypothetical protein